MDRKTKFETVDQYHSMFPKDVAVKLQQLRSAIRKEASGADEVISYNMPAFRLGGMLVYYAGYDEHIGFYPMPSAIVKFKKELSGYKTAKGSIQFPLDQPLPLELINKIVRFRVRENQEQLKLKNESKKPKTARKRS